MLSSEASEEREWCGLLTLRRILGDKRGSFVNSKYLTSVSDSEIDFLSRFALIAALTTAHRDTLSQAIMAEPSDDRRRTLADAVLSDLHHLSGALYSLASRLEAIGEDVRSVRADVERTVRV
jgi:hypothetical protein